jgi:hypothetical protein
MPPRNTPASAPGTPAPETPAPGTPAPATGSLPPGSELLVMMLVIAAGITGLFSPFLILVIAFRDAWFPAFIPMPQSILFYLSSLIVATLTLMLGGIPAALYERLTGDRWSMVGLSLWVVGVIALAVVQVVLLR